MLDVYKKRPIVNVIMNTADHGEGNLPLGVRALGDLHELYIWPEVLPSGKRASLGSLSRRIPAVRHALNCAPQPATVSQDDFVAMLDVDRLILRWMRPCIEEIHAGDPTRWYSFAEVLCLACSAVLATATRDGWDNRDVQELRTDMEHCVAGLCGMYDSAVLEEGLGPGESSAAAA